MDWIVGKFFIDHVATRTLRRMKGVSGGKRWLKWYRVRDHRLMGMITPLGSVRRARFGRICWQAAVAVVAAYAFDCEGFPSRVAAQIDDFDPSDFLAKRRIQWTDRARSW